MTTLNPTHFPRTHATNTKHQRIRSCNGHGHHRSTTWYARAKAYYYHLFGRGDVVHGGHIVRKRRPRISRRTHLDHRCAQAPHVRAATVTRLLDHLRRHPRHRPPHGLKAVIEALHKRAEPCRLEFKTNVGGTGGGRAAVRCTWTERFTISSFRATCACVSTDQSIRNASTVLNHIALISYCFALDAQ